MQVPTAGGRPFVGGHRLQVQQAQASTVRGLVIEGAYSRFCTSLVAAMYAVRRGSDQPCQLICPFSCVQMFRWPSMNVSTDLIVKPGATPTMQTHACTFTNEVMTALESATNCFHRGTLTEAVSRGAMLQTVNGIPQLGCLDVRHVLATAREIASAMTYLHSQNVLHGDLNGNNILLVGSTPTAADDRDFSAKVADFGLSRMLAPGRWGWCGREGRPMKQGGGG